MHAVLLMSAEGHRTELDEAYTAISQMYLDADHDVTDPVLDLDDMDYGTMTFSVLARDEDDD